MKTTIDIPDNELKEAIHNTHAQTKRDAVVQAVADFNRRRRLGRLVKMFGTCRNMMTLDELEQSRRVG